MRLVNNRAHISFCKGINTLMKLVVFDFETSGLDPAQGAEPHQLAAIMLEYSDTKELIEVSRFAQRDLRLNNPAKADFKALSISEKTLEEVQAGEDPKIVFNDFLVWIMENIAIGEKVIPAGHNVQFDITFMKKAFEDYLQPFKYNQVFDYHSVCVFTLSHFWLSMVRGVTKKSSLVTLTKHYGIPHDPHRAMQDVEAAVEVLKQLNKEMVTASCNLHTTRIL
jgi:DNA polymerase III epsilon subunit-like protein